MIEVISSILEAERRAQEIIDAATVEAKKTRADGEAYADKIVSDAIALMNVKRKSAAVSANKDAETIFCEIVSDGDKASKEKVNAAYSKKERAEKFVIDKIL